ncbi:hypothetical protein HK102_003063 [Quaeritorhiza haematococci]|nr:hypothetical protein HK102_003063 [Quaeritorhiza haematococci]
MTDHIVAPINVFSHLALNDVSGIMETDSPALGPHYEEDDSDSDETVSPTSTQSQQGHPKTSLLVQDIQDRFQTIRNSLDHVDGGMRIYERKDSEVAGSDQGISSSGTVGGEEQAVKGGNSEPDGMVVSGAAGELLSMLPQSAESAEAGLTTESRKPTQLKGTKPGHKKHHHHHHRGVVVLDECGFVIPKAKPGYPLRLAPLAPLNMQKKTEASSSVETLVSEQSGLQSLNQSQQQPQSTSFDMLFDLSMMQPLATGGRGLEKGGVLVRERGWRKRAKRIPPKTLPPLMRGGDSESVGAPTAAPAATPPQYRQLEDGVINTNETALEVDRRGLRSRKSAKKRGMYF